jgi:hypothetical protein
MDSIPDKRANRTGHFIPAIRLSRRPDLNQWLSAQNRKILSCSSDVGERHLDQIAKSGDEAEFTRPVTGNDLRWRAPRAWTSNSHSPIR